MMIISALYSTNTNSWIFIVLDHSNHSPRVVMSLKSDTLSWFSANQSLLLLPNDTYLVKKLQLPIWLSLVWLDKGLNPQSSTLIIKPLLRVQTILDIGTYCKYNYQMIMVTVNYIYIVSYKITFITVTWRTSKQIFFSYLNINLNQIIHTNKTDHHDITVILLTIMI